MKEKYTNEIIIVEFLASPRKADVKGHPGRNQLGDVPLKKKIISGHPSSVILEEVSNEKIDLVVMGSHGYGPIARVVLGSVSQRVLRKATCSVLIVK